jgi:hypothetical protein
VHALTHFHRVAGSVLLALLVAGCGGPADPSASFFPTKKLAAAPPAAVDSNFSLPVGGPPIPRGSISRPDPQLTPGAVATHDLNMVCQGVKHPRAPISAIDQQAVFAAYQITTKQNRYSLDYLVPLQLGGAPVQANIWPVLNRGVGFHQKASLNSRLRFAVCRGDVPLDVAQKQIATDWFSLWLRYGS